MQRPISVTIIAWFLIVTSAIGLISSFFISGNEVAMRMLEQSNFSPAVHMAVGVVGALITLLCGYGMLKGFNWSRFLYVGWSLVGIIFAYAALKILSTIALSVVLLAIIAFFLFRPNANAWFTRAALPAG
jgi:hypothetical protein